VISKQQPIATAPDVCRRVSENSRRRTHGIEGDATATSFRRIEKAPEGFEKSGRTDGLLAEKSYKVGGKWVYIFNHREA
jgi:hypothetical protein